MASTRPDLIPEMFPADGIGFDESQPYQGPGHTRDHTHVAIAWGVTLKQLLAAHPNKKTPPDLWLDVFVPVLGV